MIREKIQSELSQRQMSISELSRQTGIRRATLSDFLNGHYEMRLKHIENVLNTLKMYQSNTSGFVGVSKIPRSDKWSSRIRVNDKTHYLGQYEIKYDAVNARNKFIIDNNLK